MQTTTVMAQLGALTNRTLVLPIVMLALTERCNSACVSCAWWNTRETPATDGELTLDDIDRLAADLAGLGTRLVVFTGGEPLVRTDMLAAAQSFTRRGIRLHLLTSGLALDTHAAGVAAAFSRIIVSLDGSTAERYRAVRGVAGFDAVRAGISRLRQIAPTLPVSARTTLHAANFRDLPALISTARTIGCASISFLAADLSSRAFGARDMDSLQSLQLSRAEVIEFEHIVEQVIHERAGDLQSGFIVEPPARLRQLVQYYAALNGDARFPPKACNAPWMSAVIGANGDVRPCFFHDVVGNVRRDRIASIARSALPAFRRTLDVATNATCRRCVCSLKVGWRSRPWQ
jgi:MoaA/NifB/PqqE/SkfB family radical SAM enzyme